MALVGALGLTALLAALDAPAPARDPRVGVLFLLDDESAGAASQLHGIVRATLEARTPVEVTPYDPIAEVNRRAPLEACAGDGACFVRRWRASADEVDLLLIVSAAQLEGERVLGLRLLDASHEHLEIDPQIGAHVGELDEGADVASLLPAWLADVFPASLWDRVGELRVMIHPMGTEVKVGERSCKSPCVFRRIEVGAHRVTASHPGFDPFGATVHLAPGAASTIVAELRPPREPPTPLYQNGVFWSAVVVVAAVSSVIAAARIASD